MAYTNSPFAGAQIDFSALAGIGQSLGQGYQRRQLESELGGAINPDGSINFEKAAAIVTKQNPVAGLKILSDKQLADSLIRYRDAEATKPLEPTAAQRDADYFAKLPPGDPRLKYAPRGNAKPLNRQVVNDLSTKGELAFKTNHFAETFKDEYGGWGASGLGNAANAIARYTGIGDEAASTWWQDYQRHKNVVRNQLFGSALTATEAQQFERADVNPGMTPKAIRENLAIQREAANRAARKLGKVYMRQGADQELVEEALGISMDDSDSLPPPQDAGAPPRQPIIEEADAGALPKDRFGAPQPKPEWVKKLTDLLAQYPDPKDQKEIMEEWERHYKLGAGAADHFLGRDVQAGR